MRHVTRTLFLIVIPSVLFAAGSPPDLEVGLPTGSPFDSIKIPKETPTGGRPNDTKSKVTEKPKSGQKSGHTVAEDPKKVPPPKPPSGLPGVKAPKTRDYAGHLNWKPKDDLVDWKNPLRPATATGGKTKEKEEEKEDPKDAAKWRSLLKTYPPKVPNDIYEYSVTRFLMVMIHLPQVSQSELTEFLIEMGYPAYYAATAAKNEKSIRTMTTKILASIGPMVKVPPRKPRKAVVQRIYLDLLKHYPYEPEFGKYILSRPSGETLPVLLDIVKNHKHPFLVRNALFILRCFNNPEVVGPLRDKLMKTRDPVSRNRALAALVRWGDLSIAKWLGKKIGSRDTFRTYAVWALGRIGAIDQIERVIEVSRKRDPYGEFLLSSVPALGRLGRAGFKEKREKIVKFLRRLQGIPLQDPPSSPSMAADSGNPDGSRKRIIGERVKIALALCGEAAEVTWLKELGEQSETGSKVHITNVAFFNETLKIVDPPKEDDD